MKPSNTACFINLKPPTGHDKIPCFSVVAQGLDTKRGSGDPYQNPDICVPFNIGMNSAIADLSHLARSACSKHSLRYCIPLSLIQPLKLRVNSPKNRWRLKPSFSLLPGLANYPHKHQQRLWDCSSVKPLYSKLLGDLGKPT